MADRLLHVGLCFRFESGKQIKATIYGAGNDTGARWVQDGATSDVGENVDRLEAMARALWEVDG